MYDNFHPELAAQKLREDWGITGPIHDMVRLLERKGVFVSSLPVGNESIDAFSQPSYVKGEKRHIACVVLGSEKESAVRRQFCAAHELGHLVLHNWDIDVEELKTTEFRNQEDEANCFAGAFLLPADEFSSDIQRFNLRLDTFVELKRKWHVSVGAQIMRAHGLGIIDDEAYVRLMKSYSARGWRKEEPFDDLFQLEAPVLGQMAVDLLINSGKFTPKTLLEEFANNGISLQSEFIEELLSLKKGTLNISNEGNEITPLEIKLKAE
jgi:Zn-dependent peptidase ImmA (M78 family)